MTEFPLLFTSRELVAGNGFVAAVMGCGRALLVHESNEEWWLYGVEPGGIGEGAATAAEANQLFVASVRSVLLDLAEEKTSFEDFKEAVEAFFRQVDTVDEARWEEARAALRAGATLEDPFVSNLRREPGWSACEINVLRLGASGEQATPGMNGGEPVIALAAAA